ncbi:MAG: glycoside hydrolase family 25 protein [Magnetospirillum sp.]|nr:glycoside hydrolase family 25 protein [Magnetospirillum sp.]
MNLSRRTLMAGLAAFPLAACGTRPQAAAVSAPPQPDAPFPLPPATPGWVADPARAGLNAVIDLSHSSMVRDFAAAREEGRILGVIHKATEGVGFIDPLYAERRAQAQAAGLMWGAYHFGTFEWPGADQAAAFLATAQPQPDTLIALDLELNERDPANSMDIGRAEDFVRAVHAATGRLPLLYVHPVWADGGAVGGYGRTLGGAIRPGSILAACDLWLADYRATPQLPSAWAARGWRLWQYAGDADGRGGGPFRDYARSVAGIDRCDRNVFVSDEERLRRYWREQAGRERPTV